MDCPVCGLPVESIRSDGLYCDGDQIKCECGTIVVISVDAEQEEVWIQRYICKHGKEEEEPCPECDT